MFFFLLSLTYYRTSIHRLSISPFLTQSSQTTSFQSPQIFSLFLSFHSLSIAIKLLHELVLCVCLPACLLMFFFISSCLTQVLFYVLVFNRYTVFDSKQMPQITQTSTSHAPLLMTQQQQSLQSSSNMSSTGQMMHNPLMPPSSSSPHQQQQQSQVTSISVAPQLDVLSVSSKKICSYCNHELGSGAAMIIENLGLFYHINCFKCSVCQTEIADGNIHGTDVRVRNSRLHCANCFSNEAGIKFSCV